MEKLKMTIALDQNFTEKELHKISEILGGAFDLKNRAYILKTSEENPPTAVFSFGEITKEILPYLLGVLKSDYWKKVRKEISKILGKRRRDEEPLLSLECVLEGVKINMRCRTSNHKTLENAFEYLDHALDSIWTLIYTKNLPGQKPQLFLGFSEDSKRFRIDRALVLRPEYGEYEFNEKSKKWAKIEPIAPKDT